MPSGSPATINDTEVAGMLKRLYNNLSVDFFPMSHVLLANITRAGNGGPFNMRWGGAGVYYNAVLGSPVGLTASANGYLPPDAQRTEVQGVINPKRVYVRRQVDMLLINGTQSKEAAYRTIGTKIAQEAKAAYKRGMQRYAHGDGTGVLALVSTFSSATSIIVQSPYGVSGAGQGGLHLGVGQYVALLDVTNSDAVLGRAYITALSHSGDSTTVTLGGSGISGGATGDKLVVATANDTEGATASVPSGLINISNRGGSYADHNGISASTYTETAPVRMVAGTDTDDASTITEEDAWELIARVAGKSGFDARQNPDEFLFVTTPGLEKKLALSFFGQREWAMAPKVKLEGGFQAVAICGVPVVADPHCPAGTLYLIHKPSLCWVNAKDFGAVTFNDSSVWRWVSDRDAYETSWSEFINFAAPQRNAIGSLTGVTDTARYTHI